MPDLKKVIKGLECCILRDPDDHARCSQCPYGGNCVNRLKMDALTLLKAQDVPETNIGEWVSVKDRLPGTRHAVLAYTPHHKNIWAVSMHEDGNWYIWSPGNRVLVDPDWYGPITHWMPLPEPPKEGT